jgi:UDP-N-acetyl-D-mannosaminuronic acid transferase (WecB/TagA/CpsF family)
MDEALLRIDDLAQYGMNDYVLTPNVDHIVKVENDVEFKEIYEHASLILADGKPLLWISKLFGTH